MFAIKNLDVPMAETSRRLKVLLKFNKTQLELLNEFKNLLWTFLNPQRQEKVVMSCCWRLKVPFKHTLFTLSIPYELDAIWLDSWWLAWFVTLARWVFIIMSPAEITSMVSPRTSWVSFSCQTSEEWTRQKQGKSVMWNDRNCSNVGRKWCPC